MESDQRQEAPSHGRPIDYAFRFVYFSGGKPPDDYYELIIELAPDGSGELHFQRDYEANRPEEFVNVFDAEEGALELVYRMMMSSGICEPIWQPPPRRKDNPDGYSARLDVTCGGNFFEITPARFDSLGETGISLIEAIRALVPTATWDRIEKFQRPKP